MVYGSMHWEGVSTSGHAWFIAARLPNVSETYQSIPLQGITYGKQPPKHEARNNTNTKPYIRDSIISS